MIISRTDAENPLNATSQRSSMRCAAGMLLMMLVGCGDHGERDATPVNAPPATAPIIAPEPLPLPKPAPSLVLDVTEVTGESEAGVAMLLGEPESCEDIHRARLCRYPPHGNEVMFVAGKADMITVHGMDAVAFDEHALRALGFAAAAPAHRNDRAIRWETIEGLQEVAVFAAPDGTVEYGYVKVGRH
ncbi:MAG: hypothetical protein M3Q42_04175 [Pseudomonadota bacterium]|nr:hypothetical protein [Pseudomonadota bacterium]